MEATSTTPSYTAAETTFKVTVTPAVVVTGPTYTLIDRVSKLAPGDYYMAAYVDEKYVTDPTVVADRVGYHLFYSITSNNGGTEHVQYNPATGALSGVSTAVLVTVASTGVANQYILSWKQGDATKWFKMGSKETSIGTGTSESEAVKWNATDAPEAGIFLTAEGSVKGVMKTATAASTRFIRTYAETNTTPVGVFFLKKNAE